MIQNYLNELQNAQPTTITSDNDTTMNNVCIYLLPCGLCKLTNSPCPKHWTTGKWWEEPKWIQYNEITCSEHNGKFTVNINSINDKYSK